MTNKINTETPARELTTDGLFDELNSHRPQLLAVGWELRSILDSDRIGAIVDLVEDPDQLDSDLQPRVGDSALRGVLAAVGIEDGEGTPFRVGRDPIYESPMVEYCGPLTPERVGQLELVADALIALTQPHPKVAA